MLGPGSQRASERPWGVLLFSWLAACGSAPPPALDRGFDPLLAAYSVIEVTAPRASVDRWSLARTSEGALSMRLLELEPSSLRIESIDDLLPALPAGEGRWSLSPGSREFAFVLEPEGRAQVLAEGTPEAFSGLAVAVPEGALAHVEVGARFAPLRPLRGKVLVELRAGAAYTLECALGPEGAHFGLRELSGDWVFSRQVGLGQLALGLATDEADPRTIAGGTRLERLGLRGAPRPLLFPALAPDS